MADKHLLLVSDKIIINNGANAVNLMFIWIFHVKQLTLMLLAVPHLHAQAEFVFTVLLRTDYLYFQFSVRA